MGQNRKSDGQSAICNRPRRDIKEFISPKLSCIVPQIDRTASATSLQPGKYIIGVKFIAQNWNPGYATAEREGSGRAAVNNARQPLFHRMIAAVGDFMFPLKPSFKLKF